MNWPDRAVLASEYENAFHRHFQRPTPTNPRLCFIADAFRCRNIRPNRTSGARQSSIKMAVSLPEPTDKTVAYARACIRSFLFFYPSVLGVTASRASAMFPRFAVIPSLSRLRRRDEMNRRISDERTSPGEENSREYSDRTGAMPRTHNSPIRLEPSAVWIRVKLLLLFTYLVAFVRACYAVSNFWGFLFLNFYIVFLTFTGMDYQFVARFSWRVSSGYSRWVLPSCETWQSNNKTTDFWSDLISGSSVQGASLRHVSLHARNKFADLCARNSCFAGQVLQLRLVAIDIYNKRRSSRRDRVPHPCIAIINER